VYPAAGCLAGVQSPKNLGDITPEYKTGSRTRFSEGTSPMTKPPAAAFSTLPSGKYWGCRSASMRSPLLDAPWTQKGWCPGSSWILTAVLYMLIMDCQQRITVGGASCACVSHRDSIGLHNVGGRMGEFRLLYLLCMLRSPVPLHSLRRELHPFVEQMAGSLSTTPSIHHQLDSASDSSAPACCTLASAPDPDYTYI
jgi:hypothetical protein